MISEAQLLALLGDLESFRVERTVSTNNTAKFSEAICAFANDMHGAGEPGFLLVGADDKTGRPAGTAIDDEILRNLSGLTSNGNVLPPPAITAYRIKLSSGEGEIAVVEVQPSNLPPVRYRGQVWIRRGPRKGIANESEERLLTERRTAGARTFDSEVCLGASLSDLALDLFTTGYRPLAVDPEVIAENDRPIEYQLASLRFFDLKRNSPTNAGVLTFGKDVLRWFPLAFVQFVQFDGPTMAADVLSEKRFSGNLPTMVRNLRDFVGLITTARPVRVSELEEKIVSDYPETAIRELLINAVLHRSYDSLSPARFYQFSDRIEIQNPGPLYGDAREINFPSVNTYRNPILAEVLRTLGVVNRFGRGVQRAQEALAKNGNAPAEFTFGSTYFAAAIKARV